MIDPVTAVAAATKSYSMIRAMIEAGRSAEDTMMQLGQWYSSASDVLYAEKKAQNANPFKKLVFSKSVEAEAAKAFAAKKKIEVQQRELLSLIGMMYGKEGLAEFRDMRKQILKDRQTAVYRQAEMREQILQGCLIVILCGVMVFLVGLILS